MDFTWLTKLEWKVFNVMKQEGPTKLIQANHITCCGPGSPNSSSFQRMHLKTKSWWYAAGKLDQHEHFAVQFMATAWTTYMHGQICSWYITKRLLVFFFFFHRQQRDITRDQQCHTSKEKWLTEQIFSLPCS